jgi:5-formyltetrahydrofolate cyclo-ligase
MSIEEDKQLLRRRMRALRLVADQKFGPDAALAVTRHGLAAMDRLGLRPGVVVAGYYPIVTELDVRPLLARFEERGVPCALPVVVGPGQPLLFRRWRPIEDVEEGDHGTWQPPVTAAAVRPDVVLVPALAVDGSGYRLGNGGGYYDRTLAALRAAGPIAAVGVTFAALRVERLPHAAHDQRLDWLLSEDGLVRVEP